MKLNKPSFIALFAGILLPFAFAPFYLSAIALAAPALLLYSWSWASPAQAAYRGFLFGIGFFGIGVSWVYVSIHNFGQAPVLLSIFITLAFVCFLSLFTALQGYCVNKFCPEDSTYKYLFVFPSSWVLCELLRTWLFSGFPWLLLGYSQTNTWLKGYAPFLGIYGLSLIVALLSGSLIFLQQKTGRLRLSIGIGFVIVILVGGLLGQINWTSQIGPRLKITTIQANIEQHLKWQPQQLSKTLDLYSQYTLANWASDLIIWPEGAIPLPLQQAKDFLQQLSALAKTKHTAIITGIPIITKTNIFNGMVTIGDGSGSYYKRHLVPFGEYIPLKPIFNIIFQMVHIPMSNFDSGSQSQAPLFAKGVFIAPYICYEVAYPLEFLSFLPKAQLLLTITDDSWFGHSIAAAQHLQMAQMRALETGRYFIFSSNTGITAILNPHGGITQSIPPYQENVLTATVQPMQGQTPWMYWKLSPILIFIFLTIMYRGIRA